MPTFRQYYSHSDIPWPLRSMPVPRISISMALIMYRWHIRTLQSPHTAVSFTKSLAYVYESTYALTTLAELAEHLHLSTAAISRALNHQFGAGTETRRCVLSAAAELDFVPHSGA
jgi:hypothetical protein